MASYWTPKPFFHSDASQLAAVTGQSSFRCTYSAESARLSVLLRQSRRACTHQSPRASFPSCTAALYLSDNSPSELAGTLRSMAYRRATVTSAERESLVQELRSAVQQMRVSDAAWVAWALAKLDLEDSFVLDQLISLATVEVGNLDHRSLSHFLWGIAKFGRRTGTQQLLQQVVESVGSRCQQLPVQTLSNILWAFARLQQSKDLVFLAAMAEACRIRLRSFEPQGLANMLWAFARLGYVPEGLLAASVGQTVASITRFEPQHLANLMWSWAKLDAAAPRPLLDAVCAQALQQIHLFKSQELFNLTWAFARLEYHPWSFMERVAEESAARIYEFSTGELPYMLWSFAKLKHITAASTHLCQRACHLLPQRLDWKTKDLPVVIWSLSTLRFQAPVRTLEKLAAGMQQAEARLSALDCVMMASGLAEQRFLPSRLLAQIAQEAAAGVVTFQGSNMVQLIDAFARLGVSPKPLLSALEANPAALDMMLNSLHLTEVMQLFWSTVVAGAYDSECYAAALLSIQSRQRQYQTAPSMPRQLVFALLLAAEENEDEKARSILKAFGGRARAPYFKHCEQRKLSPEEAVLAEALTDLGFSVRVLHKLDRAQVLVPCVAATAKGLCAVEILWNRDLARVEGPAVNQTVQIMGDALIRHRLIRSQGLEVVPIEASMLLEEAKAGTHLQYVNRLLRPLGRSEMLLNTTGSEFRKKRRRHKSAMSKTPVSAARLTVGTR